MPRFAREGGPDRIGQADPFAEPRQRTVRYERRVDRERRIDNWCFHNRRRWGRVGIAFLPM